MVFHWLKNILFHKKAATEIERGYFDDVRVVDDQLHLGGWMLTLDGPYDRVSAEVNGTELGSLQPAERPDVAAVLTHIQGVLQCGFRGTLPLAHLADEKCLRIEVVGWRSDSRCDAMVTHYYKNMYDRIPAPPETLISRVDELRSPAFYVLKGAQNYAEFIAHIEPHRPLTDIRNALDWGCGSGRLLSFFAEYSPIERLHGCDIDREAIAWAAENLPGGTFTVVPPEPPTEYPDCHFDLVTAFSVLTHLTRSMQDAWLAEIHRVMAPGGLLIATVHGETAARTLLTSEVYRQWEHEGFYDGIHDERMLGIAPEGYYRASFQSRAWVETHWTRAFDLLDHAEHAASRYHDIVVLRKR